MVANTQRRKSGSNSGGSRVDQVGLVGARDGCGEGYHFQPGTGVGRGICPSPGRTQQVSCHSHLSSSQRVLFGVPQGSVAQFSAHCCRLRAVDR